MNAKNTTHSGSTPDWLATGMAHIWLPYTQMQTAPLPVPVVGAEGCRIHLADGRRLVDGIASWWSACHGHRHPHIIASVEKQLHTLPHAMFGGLVHEPALSLAGRLTAITPPGLERVFFSDSGSTAVEVALKMAVQYWKNLGHGKRNKFLCFRGGYHGDTMGGMSVSDPDAMHHAYQGHVPMQYVVDIPIDEYGFRELDELLDGVHKQIAGMIIEPLAQCAGGFRFHTADVLAELHRLAKRHNILFIADEIATGFGRTGHMFACQEAGITPDILCLGKALTGGTLTIAATLATGQVFEAFLDQSMDKALRHGPTFMANPLACAAASASLDLFEKEPRLRQVETIERALLEGLEPCRRLPGVRDVRVKGAIGVVEMEKGAMDLWAFRKRFVEMGVWLRPFGDCIYTMPPFVITPAELQTLTGAIHTALRETVAV